MNELALKKDLAYKKIREDIISGKYPDKRLPKEEELAKLFNFSRVTIRPALDKLEKEGLIARIRSKGTFITGNATEKRKIIVIADNLARFANPSIYILEGIKSFAVKHGIELNICERQYIEAFSPEAFSASVQENNITGIIPLLGNFIGGEEIINILDAANIPVVLPHASPNDYRLTGFACVRINQKEAWESAVRLLAEAGHRRVAAIIHSNAPDIRGYTANEYLKLQAKYGIETDRRLIRQEEYDKNSVFNAVSELMQLSNPPTAIQCYSDYFAIFVYDALKKLGFRIPDHVAVIGFCGYPGAALLSPSLSSVDFHYNALGETAIGLLVNSNSWFPPEMKTARPLITKPYELLAKTSTDIKILEEFKI